jgi:nucleotide-binding universal stress UspA family protein
MWRDAIVVTGEASPTADRRVLGSVPHRVSHHAHSAVLIVPADQAHA